MMHKLVNNFPCFAVVSRSVIHAAKKVTVKADPFAYVKTADLGVKDGGVGILKDVVSSGWTVIMTLSVSGFVVSIILCGLRLLISPKEGADVKKHVSTKALIFMGVCAGAFLFSLFMTIAKKMFG